MLNDILFALWFLLPAAAANVAPIFTSKMPYLCHWQTPIDGGRTFRGKELLGPHKTWRGLISGIVVSTFVLWLQQLLVVRYDWAAAITGGIEYLALPTLILGPLFGIGALGGDAVESFFKRQYGVKSGKSWFPFDQLDYVVGAIIVTLPFVILPVMQYFWMIILWTLAHLLGSYIGWMVGLKKQPI